MLVATFSAAKAQPLNEIPLRPIHVSPDGNDDNDGTEGRPFATLPRAVKALLGKDSDPPSIRCTILVVLHPGTYELDRPLVLGHEHLDRWEGGVHFQSDPGETAVISGGRRIGRWKLGEDIPLPWKKWGHYYAPLERLGLGPEGPRELFVHGERRRRAHHPAEHVAEFLRVLEPLPDRRSGFKFVRGDIPEAVCGGVELLFLHDWSVSRLRVTSIDHASQILLTEGPIGDSMDHFRIDSFEPHARYQLEGHGWFLDEPGEWWFDPRSQEIVYRPYGGWDVVIEAMEAVVPLSQGLLQVRGDPGAPVRGLSFRRITFAHSAWSLPAGGFCEAQATFHESRDPGAAGERRLLPAAVHLEHAEGCEFVDCRFEHFGASGVWLGAGTRSCRLERCAIEDVSGNSLLIGEDASRLVGGKPWWQCCPDQAASNHEIVDCRVLHGGRQILGAVAVWVGLARDVHIHHNEIGFHPYTGISLGWMWSSTETPAGGHVVEQNHIHHVMQILSDGGGVYTLGRQPGTSLSWNHIHDIPVNAGRAESNGMFLDEGTEGITIEGNVIHSVVRSPLRFHRAGPNLVKNNLLVLGDPDTPAIRYNATDPALIEQDQNRILEANTVGLDDVRKVLEGSGVRKSER